MGIGKTGYILQSTEQPPCKKWEKAGEDSEIPYPMVMDALAAYLRRSEIFFCLRPLSPYVTPESPVIIRNQLCKVSPPPPNFK